MPSKPFTNLRPRLVAVVLAAILPSWALMYYTGIEWVAVAAGLSAVTAVWLAVERIILREVRVLNNTVAQFSAGELGARTGLPNVAGELGDLARLFDSLAGELQTRAKAQEEVEKNLMTRAFQQTVVSALGQFALINSDFQSLLHQSAILVAQTLEADICEVHELNGEEEEVVLRAGTGWQDSEIGAAHESAERGSQAAVALSAGEPVVFEDLARETRFAPSPLLSTKGVVSGMRVVIAGQGRPFGLLGVHVKNARKFTEDEVRFFYAVATVLAMAAARKKAAGDLEKLASFAQLNPNAAMEVTVEGEITYFNEAARHLAKSVGQEHPGKILPASIREIAAHCFKTRRSVQDFETHVENRTWSWSFHPVEGAQVVHAYVADITEKLNLEAQLRQSQKMESVGQLAAGVAHDFNNMLTIIEGHAGLLAAKAGFPPQFKESVQAISFAAERAAALTRQLLLFSRRSVMQRKAVDLRELVATMSKMLQRLIGEAVFLRFAPPNELPLVHGDPGMIEQILMNLAVNARDAMPGGGALTIGVSAVQIEAAYRQTHAEARPGPFVKLEVADTGCGMDPATLTRIFEPFFTTKEVGKGTGLGLATIYGIVKQHEGWVEVESEVGKGTTFAVYLPVAANADAAAPALQTSPVAAHTEREETVLVVEDEQVLRQMAKAILEESGYHVVEAGSGVEALRVWEDHKDAINLLVTDMIMPEGMTGMELAQRLLTAKPALKVIVASGYSVEDFDTQFVRRGHAAFLQKPYTHVTLTRAVRETLDTDMVLQS